MKMVIHAAMEEISLSVCGDGVLNLCALIAQCTAGFQPPQAPESNQSGSGQVWLLKPAVIHTHTYTHIHTYTHTHTHTHIHTH